MSDQPGDSTTTASVEGLERLARTALPEYDLDVAELALITNDYNCCTFRVDTTDGARDVLRVNLPHRRRDEEIEAELTWLAALSRETDIGVPTSQRETARSSSPPRPRAFPNLGAARSSRGSRARSSPTTSPRRTSWSLASRSLACTSTAARSPCRPGSRTGGARSRGPSRS